MEAIHNINNKVASAKMAISPSMLLNNIAPVVILNSVLNKLRITLQDVKDRQITEDQLIGIASNAMISNPLSLLQERKLDIIIRAQTDLTKKAKE